MRQIRIRPFAPALLVMLMLAFGDVAGQSQMNTPAQSKPSPAATDAQSLVQLRVQVTISRYAAEKKTTNLPFTLWVTADGGSTTLNAGQGVEMPTTTFRSGGEASGPVTSYAVRNVGTNITCSAVPTGEGRFKVDLRINDSHLAPSKSQGSGATMKSLSTTNSLLLRDGQTAEFVASTDMITGEVTRIEVTATTLK